MLVVPMVLSYLLEYALFHLALERVLAFTQRLADLRQSDGLEHDPDGLPFALRS